jgi:hypothetical protein
MIVQGDFPLVHQVFIYHAFINLTLSHLLLLLYHHTLLVFNSLLYVALYYTHV